jgi:glucose/arabinose dehydrogenase
VRTALRAPVRAGLLAVGLALAIAFPAVAGAVTLPSGFQDTTVPFEGLESGQGIEEPTAFRFAPDGKVFVAEKSGKILVYDSLADHTPTLFADLRTEVYNANDRGLLGLALDPQFSAAHPYVYVLYSYDAPPGQSPPYWGEAGQDGDDCPEPPGANTNGCVIQGRLSRLTADLSTDHMLGEQPLITDWCQQFSSHSVGDLQFDAEGNLLVSGGEGASFENADYGQFGEPINPCGDPPAGVGGEENPPASEGGALRAQNPKKLSGSLIRVDPETGQGVPGNPLFASLDANERRLIAKGFRNPFRFTVDPTTNEIYVDNVGSSVYEEIDRFTPSSTSLFNSGWPCYEGPAKRELYEFLGLAACERLYKTPGSTESPFYYYSHEAGVTPGDPCPYEPGSAIAGLTFYEGGDYPEAYDGALFFADAVRGCIYVIHADDGEPDLSTAEPFLTEGGLYPGVDIEVGPEGDLFYANLYGPGFGPGAIHRISYDPDVPHAQLKATSSTYGAAPLNVEFDAGESTDPQGEELKYEWDLDGNGTFGPPTPDATQSETYPLSENRTAAVRVIDEHGHSSVAQLTVYPDDTPPVPTVEEPTESLQWRVGENIPFKGKAEDNEDGTLAPARLYWRSRLLHCPGGPTSCHSHPLQVFPAVASGNLVAPSHDYPSYIELTLTATDSRGLSASKTVKIAAHPVQLTMVSKPAGITLSAGLETAPAPFDLKAIEDSKITVSAPEKASVGGETYVWSSWSDGGARTHTIDASGSGSLIATYSPTGTSTGTTGTDTPPTGGPGSNSPPLRLRLSSHPKIASVSRTARFVFSVNRSGVGFRCRLDHRRYLSCKSPQVYRRLKPGRHIFAVVATGPGDAVEGTPVEFSWRVLPSKPKKR